MRRMWSKSDKIMEIIAIVHNGKNKTEYHFKGTHKDHYKWIRENFRGLKPDQVEFIKGGAIC